MPGIFSEDDIEITFLSAYHNAGLSSRDLPQNASRIAVAKSASVVAVEPLCKPMLGLHCITNGTKVRLRSLIGCGESLAGVSFKARQAGGKVKIMLYLPVYGSETKLACADQAVESSISLTGIDETDLDDIEIQLLKTGESTKAGD